MKTCLQATMDLERSAFERLSLADRIGIRLHLSICPQCRKYFRDSKTMDRLISKSFSQPENFTFSLEEKEKMKRDIQG